MNLRRGGQNHQLLVIGQMIPKRFYSTSCRSMKLHGLSITFGTLFAFFHRSSNFEHRTLPLHYFANAGRWLATTCSASTLVCHYYAVVLVVVDHSAVAVSESFYESSRSCSDGWDSVPGLAFET
jgi:hypothetical protein